MAIFLSQQVMGGNRLLDIPKFNNPHEKVARRELEVVAREAVELEVVARGNSSLSTSREAVEREAMPRGNSSLSTSGEVEEREVDELLEVVPRGNSLGEAGQELTRRRNSALTQVGKGEVLHARRRNSVLPLSGEQDRRNDGRPSFGDETGSFLPLPRQESYRRRNSAIRPVVGKEAALHARRSLFSAFWNPPSSEGSVPSPPEGYVPSPPEGYFSSPPEGPLSSPINLIDFEEKEAQLTTSEGSIPPPINLIDFEENDAQSMRERNLEQQLNEQIRLNQDLRNAMRFQEIHFENKDTWIWGSWSKCEGTCPDKKGMRTRSGTQDCPTTSCRKNSEIEACSLDCPVESVKCEDLDSVEVDEDGDHCAVYDENPSYCAKFDLPGPEGLHSGDMCCACGGGSIKKGTYVYKGCSSGDSLVVYSAGAELDNYKDNPPKVQCELACVAKYETKESDADTTDVVDYISVGSDGTCKCGISNTVVSVSDLKVSCKGEHWDIYEKPPMKYYFAYEGVFTDNEKIVRGDAYQDIRAEEDLDTTYPAYCCGRIDGKNTCKRAIPNSCGGCTWLDAEHHCKQMGLKVCTQSELQRSRCKNAMKASVCKEHVDSIIWTRDLRQRTDYDDIHGTANWIAVNNRIPELEFVGVGTNFELPPAAEEEDGVDMRRRNSALPVFREKDAIYARRRNGALPLFGEASDSNSTVVKRVYWDRGTCGPEGNDANWEICNFRAFDCPASIETHECPGGIAEKSLSIEATIDRPHVINRCGYIYYVEYSCPKVEEGRRILSEKVGDFLTSHK